MIIDSYMKAGYACLFVETGEIKRAVNSICVSDPFQKMVWDFIDGIKDVNGQVEEASQIDILNKAKEYQNKAIILENYDFFLENQAVQQLFLNNYELFKSNRVCLVLIGNTASKIPIILKELIPVIQFDLPKREEVQKIAETISITAEEDFKQHPDYNKLKKDFDFTVSDEVISACLGLSHEEIENALALSLIEHKCFNIKSILERKRQIIKSTGFMDFMNPEPIENLGGLDNLKDYIYKRKEAFEENSNKPRIRALLLVGLQGCGKSQAVKAISSIFDWPLITLDIGGMKGGIVGQTEQNVRLAVKTIDAFGKAIVMADEIEKSLSGASGQNLDSGVSVGMLGTLLTWMQERKSEGIIVATANDLTKLPPEFLRAGRFDCIWFVDAPNENEIKAIIEIMNRKYKSNLPTDEEFCKQLAEEQWTGAEIEQLAKDSHFDDIETAMNNIPLLSEFRKDDIKEIRERAKQFRAASSKGEAIRGKKKLELKKNKPTTGRKLNLH